SVLGGNVLRGNADVGSLQAIGDCLYRGERRCNDYLSIRRGEHKRPEGLGKVQSFSDRLVHLPVSRKERCSITSHLLFLRLGYRLRPSQYDEDDTLFFLALDLNRALIAGPLGELPLKQIIPAIVAGDFPTAILQRLIKESGDGLELVGCTEYLHQYV